MKCLSALLLSWVLCVAVPAQADDSLAHARRAQGLLGADVWSQLIRVENTGRSRSYPRTVNALIFELAGILWFYTDANGTQSFSTHRGRLAEDKNNLSPLLLEIDSGFTAWTAVVADERATAAALSQKGPLLNGCLIESVANLRSRVMAGAAAGRAQLLSYYVELPDGMQGHTVLTCETDDAILVIDPASPERLRKFSSRLSGDARALATRLVGRKVAKAVWVKVNDFAPPRIARYASLAVDSGSAMN